MEYNFNRIYSWLGHTDTDTDTQHIHTHAKCNNSSKYIVDANENTINAFLVRKWSRINCVKAAYISVDR